MDNRTFFKKAIKAAQKSPEAFAFEFKQPGADANAYIYARGNHYDYLIHALIRQIPDDILPFILKTLIEHQVDLKRNTHYVTPLAEAATCGKMKAIHFLLEQKVNINDSEHPAIIAAITSSSVNKLDIVKVLIERGADINILTRDRYTPLMEAVKLRDPKLVELLLSKNADLLQKHTWFFDSVSVTAVNLAYELYCQAKAKSGSDNLDAIQYMTCLEILVRCAAIQYFQQNPFPSLKKNFILKKYINNLIGGSGYYSYDSDNYTNLMIELEKKLILLIKEIQNERCHAFFMGSRLTKKQEENKESSSIFCFFQKQGDDQDLARLVVSFLKGKKEEVEVSEIIPTKKRKR